MTWIDGAAIGIILISGMFSLVRGVVRELLGIAAWAGAALAALAFYPVILPKVASLISMKAAVLPVSILLVFVVVLIILSIVSAWVSGLVRDSALSGLDRTLGLVFGLLRGVFILCIAYIGLSMALPAAQWPEPVANARFLPFFYNGATMLAGLLPPDYQPKIAPPPVAGAPSAGTLMQQPVAGKAL